MLALPGSTDRRVKYAAQLCADALLMMTPKGTPDPNCVLIVRVDAIGDFVLWLDAAQAIVKHYKAQGKCVILVGNAAWAAWAKQLAIFDDVIALDRNRYELDVVYRFRLGHTIRKLKCSIAVQPTYSREWLRGDAVVRISGARERIGSTGDSKFVQLSQKRIADRWYTRLIYANPTPCMELLRNAEFVRGLGETNFLAKIPDLRAVETFRSGESFAAAIPAEKRYYVLFPGASWEGRQWPTASFVQVAERLHDKFGWHGVVCGSHGESEIAENLCRQSSAPLLNWTGRTDLSQLAALLSTAQLLLTNETSAAHIAATLGVPTVCILGGGHYGRFMPYQVEQTDGRPLPRAVTFQMPCFGCNWQCIYPRSPGTPAPCIERITAEEVWRAIGELLGLPSQPAPGNANS